MDLFTSCNSVFACLFIYWQCCYKYSNLNLFYLPGGLSLLPLGSGFLVLLFAWKSALSNINMDIPVFF